MAAFRSGQRRARRWTVRLTLAALLAALGCGVLLWRAVEFDSVTGVAARIEHLTPIATALRCAAIGCIAWLWPFLVTWRLRDHALTDHRRAFWLAQRWRVVAWLLVLEACVGQNVALRALSLMADPR